MSAVRRANVTAQKLSRVHKSVVGISFFSESFYDYVRDFSGTTSASHLQVCRVCVFVCVIVLYNATVNSLRSKSLPRCIWGDFDAVSDFNVPIIIIIVSESILKWHRTLHSKCTSLYNINNVCRLRKLNWNSIQTFRTFPVDTIEEFLFFSN